jgi:hypothetical protein
MPALAQFPDILVERKSGEYKMTPDGKDVMLKFGSVFAAPGGVRIHNNSEKWLTFNIYEDDGLATRTEVDKRKINPGKSLRVSAPGGLDAPAGKAGIFWYYLGAFELKDTDPSPTDGGGQTDEEIKWDEVKKWFAGNWWLIVAAIVFAIIVYLLFLYLRG